MFEFRFAGKNIRNDRLLGWTLICIGYWGIVEDFLIQHCQDLKVGDLVVVKSEWASGKKDRKGKRQYLSDAKTREMVKHLSRYLEGIVEVPRKCTVIKKCNWLEVYPSNDSESVERDPLALHSLLLQLHAHPITNT